MVTSLKRREFLKMGGGITLGAALLPSYLIPRFSKANPGIAIQLYTVRTEFEKDIPGTLKRIREIGFEYVETAFWPKDVTLAQAAKYIRDAGLKVAACHVEIPIGEHQATMLETARAFDCKKMIWHGWPEDKRYSSLEGTKELIGIYNDAGKWAASQGLSFGLHNHWWEYRNKVGGRFVYEWLLEGVNPEIFFELDTYWLKTAGKDPAQIIQLFGSRAKFLHLKDGPARWSDDLPKDNPDPMTPLGQGTQNLPAIFKAAEKNIEWLVLEMDQVSIDVYEAIKESYAYLQKNGLVSAR